MNSLKAKEAMTLTLKEGKNNEIITKGEAYVVKVEKVNKILVTDNNGDNRWFKTELFEEIVEEKKPKKKKKKVEPTPVIEETDTINEEEGDVDDGQQDDIQDEFIGSEPEDNYEESIQ